jgi:hypothetical protein
MSEGKKWIEWTSPIILILGILGILIAIFSFFFYKNLGNIETINYLGIIAGLFAGIAFIIRYFIEKRKLNNFPVKEKQIIESVENNSENGSGFGTAGFILGIFALIFSISLWILSPIFIMLSIVFSVIQLRKRKTGLAIIGLILAIISLLIFITILLIAVTSTGFIFDKLALSKKDPVYSAIYECGGSVEFTLRERCYFLAAITYNSTLPCDKLSDFYGLKNECYSSVAKQLMDEKICDKILNLTSKEECIFSLSPVSENYIPNKTNLDIVTVQYLWKKFVPTTSSRVSCYNFCNVSSSCLVNTAEYPYPAEYFINQTFCIKTNTNMGSSPGLLFNECSGAFISELDFDTTYCCCANQPDAHAKSWPHYFCLIGRPYILYNLNDLHQEIKLGYK